MATLFDSPDSQLWSEEVAYADGGERSDIELHLLAPNQAARLLNITPDVTGRLQKRPGINKLGSAGTGNPNGLHSFEALLQNVHLLVGQWGGELYSSPGDATWTRRASNVSLYNTAYASAQGKGRSALPTIFLASCVGATDNVSLPYGNLVCLDTGFGVTEVAVRPRALTWFQNRLWAAGDGNPKLISWSKPLDGRDFSNGQNFEVDSSDGDILTALLPMRDGTPRIMIFGERSIHQLEIYWTTDGYFPTTANALDFTKSQLRPISLSTGCLSTRAAVWVPGQEQADVLFLSREGIRSLARSATDAQGGAPPPLSKGIDPTIQRINWAEAARSVAAYWNNIAYFSVPVDGAVRPNLVIAYDTLRGGFYELDWNVAAWTPAKLTSDRKFFFMSASSCTESGLGSPASGITNGHHIYQTDGSQVDPNNQPVQFDIQTRAFDFSQSVGGQPGSGLRVKKKLDYLDLAIQAAATCATVTIQYKLDDEDSWSTLRHIFVDPSDGFPYLPVQLPFSFSAGRVTRRSIILRDLRPCYKIQLRFLDTTSFARLKLISTTLYANPANPKFSATP